MKMTDDKLQEAFIERCKKNINNAYRMGYKYFKIEKDDGDVETLMFTLEYKGYFDMDYDDMVRNTVRKKLEKLFIKNGVDPYYEHK